MILERRTRFGILLDKGMSSRTNLHKRMTSMMNLDIGTSTSSRTILEAKEGGGGSFDEKWTSCSTS